MSQPDATATPQAPEREAVEIDLLLLLQEHARQVYSSHFGLNRETVTHTLLVEIVGRLNAADATIAALAAEVRVLRGGGWREHGKVELTDAEAKAFAEAESSESDPDPLRKGGGIAVKPDPDLDPRLRA
jgi:hypothetical protein